MAERDKVIKSGQLTLPRLIFLAVVGGIIVFIVYKGWFGLGYWLMTIGISVLLFLIAIDYGVKLDKVNLAAMQTTPAGTPPEPVTTSDEAKAAIAEARPKRRASRPVKRRR